MREPRSSDEERPSRSARKRNAEALQRLGERLLSLKPQRLQSLDLPPLLLASLLETQRLRSRSAQARARQYIGRIMREVDAGAIERALRQHATELKGHDGKMP